MKERTRHALALVIAVAAAVPAGASAHDQIGVVLGSVMQPAAGGDPSQLGRFGNPFTEPMIGSTRTDKKCIENGGDSSPLSDARHLDCKPAGVSLNVLPDRKVMYYDGLEGTENVRTSIVAE